MKRTFPLIITAVAGFILIVSFFIPSWQEWGEDAAVWFDILAAIAFILGGGNLLKLHMKSISDKKPGWGYSGVTIISFLAMLFFGLIKLGSPPASNNEFFGETFAHLPLAAMPEFRVAGTIPDRADNERLPASVIKQLRQEGDELVFQGWMLGNQQADLKDYKDTLAWKAKVEELFEAAQPAELKGVRYYVEHEMLSVDGVLDQQQEERLKALLPPSEAATKAVQQLAEKSRRQSSVVVSSIPEAFAIPDSDKDQVSWTGQQLTVTGAMSAELRNAMAVKWAGFAPARPLTQDQKQQLANRIEQLGSRFNEDQSVAFEKFFNSDWTADDLIAALNTAGTVAAVPKTARELYEEQQAGVTDLQSTHIAPAPVLLNEAQQDVVQKFVGDPEMSVTELKEQLDANGDLTEQQKGAVDHFLDAQIRDAERMEKLGLELLKAGVLTVEQRQFLFQPVAELHAWRNEIGRLYVAAHQVKFPWSGDFTAEGNPFWWTYEYIMQPLMTTTFAMLAFYVASAAFRAFRAKNLEATLLLGTAFIVLLGRTYLGVQLTAWVPDALSALKIDQMTVYIMKIFNTAGNRAIMIGIALGIASTSLKVLLGIDRSYLGSGDD